MVRTLGIMVSGQGCCLDRSSGGVRFTVSGDCDLLALERVGRIWILLPVEFQEAVEDVW